MAESMTGMKRTCRCAELSEANIGQTVTVMGWVQKQRNKGGIVFVDLRDRSGLIQLIYEEADCGTEAFSLTMDGRRLESVIRHFLRREAWEGAEVFFLFSGGLRVVVRKDTKEILSLLFRVFRTEIGQEIGLRQVGGLTGNVGEHLRHGF